MNGIRISRNDLGRDEEAGEQEDDPEELAELVEVGRADPVEAVGQRRDEAAEGDEDRRRRPAVDPPVEERLDRQRDGGDEVDDDRERGDEQVEQELVARLVRVERVVEDPALGHEDVGREDGAEDERERAGDVHERGEEPEAAREELGGRCAGRRVDRVAGRRQRRRQHEHDAQPGRPDDRQRGEARPALVREVRLDADGDRQDERGDEVEDRRAAGVRVLGAVAQGEHDQPGEQEARREGIAEPGPSQEERRAQPEPAGGPDRPGEVPRPVERLRPAVRRRERLAAGGDPEEQHPEGPDELVGPPTLEPLVDEEQAEDEGEDRGQGGQDDGQVHGSAVGFIALAFESVARSGLDGQAGTNSWSSRWRPSHSPQRGSSPGIAMGRISSRTSPTPTEQVALVGHPAPDVGRVGVELERAGVDGRPARPRRGRLGGDDVEEVDPPGRVRR